MMETFNRRRALWIISVCTFFFTVSFLQAAPPKIEPPVSADANGQLVYRPDDKGNRIVDFSHAGYMGGNEDIPNVPVRVVVPPEKGDSTARIQAAIDYVSTLPADAKGIRGAVLLQKGRYELAGQLKIAASGVVLRGSGMGQDGTVLLAGGLDRRTLIRIVGEGDIRFTPIAASQPAGNINKNAPDNAAPAATGEGDEAKASAQSAKSQPGRPAALVIEGIAITDEYVPVGSYTLTLASTKDLKAGDTVMVVRPSTQEWITALGTGEGGQIDWRIPWKPLTRDIQWDRTIVKIDGNTITLDAPITTAIEACFGGGTVRPYTWPGRIEQVGVENLWCESTFDPNNPKDESHSWLAVTMDNVQNAWLRQVTAVHFAGGAVSLWSTAKHVTVEDCKSLDPISEDGGYRRHTFFTMGQMTLFLRCWSEHGRHDFATGYCTAGPSAFVQCEANRASGFSGPYESWASGILFDNVVIDGGELCLANRGMHNIGVGWAAANCVLWQVTAAIIENYSPPTAANYAFGFWGDVLGDGKFFTPNNFIRPDSLYEAQLAQRIGEQTAEKRVQLMPMSTEGSSAPTVEQAARLMAESKAPPLQLWQWIDQAATRNPIPTDAAGAKTIDQVLAENPKLKAKPPVPPTKKMKLANGWLTIDGKPIIGGQSETVWWRGSIVPADLPKAGPAIVRWVPGRIGWGLTDDLNELADWMAANDKAVLMHHYALWHDRRRDDHQRVRRIDGDVWPPLYDLPFAHSGQGQAWDGLSKYDLTKYNPWYWSRLKEFADLAEQKGLVLLHQNYFQHNILEAGAHWADFPWRSANNINNTGFPEPPPYAGNKRIFQAELFYDTTHPIRRPLHQAYIRQCLAALADNTNVIQSCSDEFTGPLEFMRFWIDTIADWEKQTGKKATVSLSCTKDVQDAILADPVRSKIVDVIDINYWYYQADGKCYAPEGGQNLAPRQWARLLKPKASSFEQAARAVREYRMKYPGKAVTYSAPGANFGWAVLIGGGSLANVANLNDQRFLAAVAATHPVDSPAGGDPKRDVSRLGTPTDKQWVLVQEGENYIVYGMEHRVAVDLTTAKGVFTVRRFDPATGMFKDAGTQSGGAIVTLETPVTPAVLWLERKK